MCPLIHLIRVMTRHDKTNKKTNAKTMKKPNTFSQGMANLEN